MKLQINKNVTVDKNYTGACIFDGEKYIPIMEGDKIKVIDNTINKGNFLNDEPERIYTVKWDEKIKDIGLFHEDGVFHEKLWSYILSYTQGIYLIEVIEGEKESRIY